jgi:hypothetical protein
LYRLSPHQQLGCANHHRDLHGIPVKYLLDGQSQPIQGANVPIALGFLDYGKKEGGYLESYFPTGDVDMDMALIQTEYAGIKGKYPDQSRW